MALSDLWSELKRKSIVGDLGDRLRALPLVRRFRYLHSQATPLISLELLPKLKASRDDWLRSVPKGEASFRAPSRAILPGSGIDGTKRVKVM